MIKILTVVGARPQFIKAAAINRVFRTQYGDVAREIIVHTGQHYDRNMSEVFFSELEIEQPAYNLGIGSCSHGAQISGIIRGLEEILEKEKPAYVILYGDTNSTLAGAVAASRMLIPVAHIEAGLRSYKKSMPEEVSRIICDHVSSLMFCPTLTSVKNLVHEGFDADALPPYHADHPGIFHSGDVMYDNAMYYSRKAEQIAAEPGTWRDIPTEYVLATIHRDFNTDHPERLRNMIEALNRISLQYKIPVVLPIHPRTAGMIKSNLNTSTEELQQKNPLLRIIEPASYLKMLYLEKNARMVITDSGGVQKEAYFFKKPCILLREETEWTELLENKSAILADADPERIVAAFEHFIRHEITDFPPLFGNGKAAEYICREIIKVVKNNTDASDFH